MFANPFKPQPRPIPNLRERLIEGTMERYEASFGPAMAHRLVANNRLRIEALLDSLSLLGERVKELEARVAELEGKK